MSLFCWHTLYYCTDLLPSVGAGGGGGGAPDRAWSATRTGGRRREAAAAAAAAVPVPEGWARTWTAAGPSGGLRCNESKKKKHGISPHFFPPHFSWDWTQYVQSEHQEKKNLLMDGWTFSPFSLGAAWHRPIRGGRSNEGSFLEVVQWTPLIHTCCWWPQTAPNGRHVCLLCLRPAQEKK